MDWDLSRSRRDQVLRTWEGEGRSELNCWVNVRSVVQEAGGDVSEALREDRRKEGGEMGEGKGKERKERNKGRKNIQCTNPFALRHSLQIFSYTS